MTVGAGIVTTLLRIGNYVDQFVFRDLIIATVAAYIAGATIQRVKGNAVSTQSDQ